VTPYLLKRDLESISGAGSHHVFRKVYVSKYRVLRGLNYPPNKRAEKGDIVSDLPEKSVKWLLESKLIEPVAETNSAKATKSTLDKTAVSKDGE
jgi:hypothetical protein